MDLIIPDVFLIIRMQDETTEAWHQVSSVEASSTRDLLSLIRAQHRANFDLWHEEDKARDPLASNDLIAEVKHTIDRLNQCRNDLVEQIDAQLLSQFQERIESFSTAPLHSETPGMMIDRLSILALKIFHTHEESNRATATEEHRQKNLARLSILQEQRSDLAQAIEIFFKEATAGRRRFKLYRQMKMYNDPELNPVIYQHKN